MVTFYCDHLIKEYGYMKVKQDKYIDLSQFVCNKNGSISWKDNEGVVAEFFL